MIHKIIVGILFLISIALNYHQFKIYKKDRKTIEILTDKANSYEFLFKMCKALLKES